MEKRWPYFILLTACIVVLVIISMASPKKINWTPSFSSYDKIPYGNYVLYHQLTSLFPAKDIALVNSTFYNFSNFFGLTSKERIKASLDSSNYIIIDEQFTASQLDINELLNYVASGSSVFIAAIAAPDSLLDTLHIRFENNYHYRINPLLADTSINYRFNFTNPQLHKAGGYSFKKEYLSFEVQNTDSSNTDTTSGRFTVLGQDEGHRANFVRVNFGKGHFFFHTYPLAFTNYHMLKDDDNAYVAACLSYLPVRNTYWDEYYKPMRRQKAQTPLRFILSVSGYQWAYFVAILSMLVYIIFASKRNQRIIPVILPVKNLSLEFAQTIGNLYYNRGDHSDLAHKKMSYLLEKIRNTYFLPTNLMNEEFQRKLAYKSNVPLESIQTVFKIYLEQIRDARNISEQTLIVFNQSIERFYNESGLNNK